MFGGAQEGVFPARQAGGMLRVNILQWYACTALRGLGRVDEALAIGRDSMAQVGQWRGWSVGYLLGEYVWCCLASGNLADSRRSLRDFFALSKSTGWTAFAYHSHLYARMAQTEGRASDAARLLGFAEKSWRRIGTPFPDMARECRQLHAELAAVLEPALLTGMLASGAMMNEDAVCALALPDAASGSGSDKVAA